MIRILAAALVLAACGGGSDGPDSPNEPANQTGSVSGTVRDNQNGAVAGAGVQLSAAGQTSKNTVSGVDGGFTFSNVAVGVWQLAVTAPNGFTGSPTASVTVTAGAQANAGTLALEKVVVNAPLAVNVTIQNSSFAPSIATVARGGTVTWRNADQAAHTATGTGGIASPVLGNDGQYSKTFATSGTFDYVCSLHSGMTGRVVVVQ